MDDDTKEELPKKTISDETLLRLAASLTHVQAEKVAIQLKIDQGHIFTLRRMYMEDAELFAYRLLQKWWDDCQLDENEAKNELSKALRSNQLAGLARTVLGLRDNAESLSDNYIFSVVENLNCIQIENLAIRLGVEPSVLDSLRKLYSEDTQLFGFYMLAHWKESCELRPEQQKELLTSWIENPLLSTSFEGHDDIEINSGFRIYNKQNICNSKVFQYFSFIFGIILFVGILFTLLASIVILSKVPPLENYALTVQPGYSFLLPMSNLITAIDIQLANSDDDVCIGKAMAIKCLEVIPKYNWQNLSGHTFIYMSVGSFFYLHIAPSYSSLGNDISINRQQYLWFFTDYDEYTKAVSYDFQGYVCDKSYADPACFKLNGSNLGGYINFTVPKNGFYHIACYPDIHCSLIERWLMYQGLYDFNKYTSSHSYVHLIQESPVQVTFQNQFDFSSGGDYCLFAYISNDYVTSCFVQDTQVLLSNLKRCYGFLLFPSIGFFLVFISSFLYFFGVCYCCKLRLCKSNQNNNYIELTNTNYFY